MSMESHLYFSNIQQQRQDSWWMERSTNGLAIFGCGLAFLCSSNCISNEGQHVASMTTHFSPSNVSTGTHFEDPTITWQPGDFAFTQTKNKTFLLPILSPHSAVTRSCTCLSPTNPVSVICCVGPGRKHLLSAYPVLHLVLGPRMSFI